MKSVKLSANLTSIGKEALYGCYQIPEIYLAETLKTIGANAFTGLNKITTVTIPDTVTLIGAGAFQNCTALETVVMGNNVTNIGANAFANTSIKSLYIPATVTTIGAGAVEGCAALTEVTFNSECSWRLTDAKDASKKYAVDLSILLDGEAARECLVHLYSGYTWTLHPMSSNWTNEDGQHYHECNVPGCTHVEDKGYCSNKDKEATNCETCGNELNRTAN